MKNKILLQAILVLALFSSILTAQSDKEKVAVLDFRLTVGMDPNEALTLTNYFRTKLSNTGKFRLMSRDAMIEIMDEQEFNEACNSAECAVSAGRFLQTDKIVIGAIGKISNTYTITIQIIDVKTAEINNTVADTYVGDRNGLLKTVVKLAEKIAGGDGISYWWYAAGGAVISGIAYYFIQDDSKGKDKTLPQPPKP